MIEDLQIAVAPETPALSEAEIARMTFSNKKEFCVRGHRLAGDNLVKSGENLVCRACRNRLAREYQDRKKSGETPPGRVRPSHCKRGHEFTEDNTYHMTGNRRGCRTCRGLYRKNATLLKKPYIVKEYRNANLRRYGMTQADYDHMHKAQDGRCAICLQLPRHSDGRPLFIDHDHETKKVRGLLCNACNHAIGLLRENPLTLRRATNYILEGGATYAWQII